MNPPLDLEHVVTAWLRDQASASGSDRVLGAALGRVETVRQERYRPAWMRPRLSPTGQAALLTAAVLVIAVASLDVLNARLGGTAVETTVPASTVKVCPQDPGPQQPGPQLITVFAPIRLTVTLPESWLGGCRETTTAGRVDRVWWAASAWAPGGIGITTADPVPSGCEGLPGWDRVEAAIGGFSGERFDYRGGFAAPPSCHPNHLLDHLGEPSSRGSDTLFTLWTLDVNGERLSVWIKSDDRLQTSGSLEARQAELRRLVEAVQIEAPPLSAALSPRPSPTGLSGPSPTSGAAVYPPGYEIPPDDRQSLSVDGIPFSFSVPTESWMPGIQDSDLLPRSLYIGKSVEGGQAAEAVVFWTAFPNGVDADPCGSLLSPEIGPSTSELAAAMSTAPGTDLFASPLDVTLGGHEAKLVVLTVREDLGCDPGYFFTWPDECWGECWVFTDPGDTISVWIVEVNGTRVVIEAETKAIADSELEQEVQQIVESIRFE
jgi:hypothetical protein